MRRSRPLRFSTNSLWIPALLFLSYFLISYFAAGLVTGSTAAAILLADTAASAVYLFLYRRCFPSVRNRKGYRFSGAGWAVAILLLLILYVFSQAAGTVVDRHFPVEYMRVYEDIMNSDRELLLYMLVSVTVAPLAEELLCRGFLYQYLRRRWEVFPCFLVSAGAFVFLHGTTAHAPIAVGLTLFLCLLYEWTDDFRYCVLFHGLYNVCSIVFLTVLPMGEGTVLLGFFGILSCLGLCMVFVGSLRRKLGKGTGLSFQEWIEERRQRFLDKYDHRDDE